MGNGNLDVHAVDIDESAGELISFCPGGLPARAGTRHERQFAVRRACAPSFQRRSTGQTGSYRCNDRTDASLLSAFFSES
jgi:hypothetical protein